MRKYLRDLTVASTVLLSLASACSSEGPDPGSPVDLSGIWYLSDSTDLAFSGQSSSCVRVNRPVLFSYYAPESTWVGEEQDGGTRRCKFNGVPGDTVTLAGPYMVYTAVNPTPVTGDSVSFMAISSISLVGKIRSDQIMSGIQPSTSWNGRYGTWIMRRRPF